MPNKDFEVEVTVNGQSVEAVCSLPETIAEMIEAYGEEVVTKYAHIGLKTSFRNKLRSLLTGKNPMSRDEALAAMDSWDPSEVAVRAAGSGKGKLIEKFLSGELSQEDLLATLAAMREALAAKAQG